MNRNHHREFVVKLARWRERHEYSWMGVMKRELELEYYISNILQGRVIGEVLFDKFLMLLEMRCNVNECSFMRGKIKDIFFA
ncbi:hypothetical protein GPU96_05g10090 [Encephalitozoon hellem]|uniref:Uncharacterized protein n=1 Tax=Encephalitozoon hellem TaxID=27973 RepID=A0A9Q9C1U9_ENCHE|nr:hypothetical protein GPU96_02g02310 [Encephalitozoon hellem]UTX43267.1 hypothetical protein GPU96_05g10090 [Encephalitozoon hellem]